VSKGDSLLQLLQSHVWEIKTSERFAGNFGLITKIVCVKCGLEQTAVLSSIVQSKEGAENRKKQSEILSA
jgi:hypothetical protein